MNKIILAIVTLAIGLQAQAQVFTSQSFLNCRSLEVTNTIGVTNLLAVLAPRTTNMLATIFTNLNGTKINSTAANGGDTLNLLKTVRLWTDRNAMPYVPIYTNQPAGAAEMPGSRNANIYIRLIGGSGANSAVLFSFYPVPSDGGPGDSDGFGVESTAAADLIVVSVTANTTNQVSSINPLDMRRLAGCKGLKLVSIANADTDASSQVVVLECTLNGFIP